MITRTWITPRWFWEFVQYSLCVLPQTAIADACWLEWPCLQPAYSLIWIEILFTEISIQNQTTWTSFLQFWGSLFQKKDLQLCGCRTDYIYIVTGWVSLLVPRVKISSCRASKCMYSIETLNNKCHFKKPHTKIKGVFIWFFRKKIYTVHKYNFAVDCIS